MASTSSAALAVLIQPLPIIIVWAMGSITVLDLAKTYSMEWAEAASAWVCCVASVKVPCSAMYMSDRAIRFLMTVEGM